MAKALTPKQIEQRDRAVAKLRAALKRRGPSSFGSLRVLPSGVLQARYVGPDEQRYTAPATFDTLGDADAWLAGVRSDIARDVWVSPREIERQQRQERARSITIAQLFAAYLEEGDLRPRTIDLYRYQYDRMIGPTLGEHEATTLTPTDVAEWRATLPPAPRQRDQVHDLLRAILGLAVEREILDRNPAARSRRKVKGSPGRSMRRDVPRLTREEVATIAANMPEPRKFAVLLAAYTGIRFGELAALRRSDLDLVRDDDGTLSRATMTITRAITRPKGADGIRRSVEGVPKSDAGRRAVAIPTALLAAFDDHLDRHAAKGEDGLLFSGSGGGYLTPSLLYGIKPGTSKHGNGRAHPTKGRGFYLARVVAGRPDANWHQLRAFAISEAVDQGMAPADLLRRFGHVDLKTSGIYQRAAEKADRAYAERVEVLLPPELKRH